jgi:hypothetical protein
VNTSCVAWGKHRILWAGKHFTLKLQKIFPPENVVPVTGFVFMLMRAFSQQTLFLVRKLRPSLGFEGVTAFFTLRPVTLPAVIGFTIGVKT